MSVCAQCCCCYFFFPPPFPSLFCRRVFLLLNVVESSFFYIQLFAVPVIALPLAVLVLASCLACLSSFFDNVSLWFCVFVVCTRLFIAGSWSTHCALNQSAHGVSVGAGGGRAGRGLFLPQRRPVFAGLVPSRGVCARVHNEGGKPELSALLLLAAMCRTPFLWWVPPTPWGERTLAQTSASYFVVLDGSILLCNYTVDGSQSPFYLFHMSWQGRRSA